MFFLLEELQLRGRVIMFVNPNSHISRTAVHHWSHNKNSFRTISLFLYNLIRKKLRNVTITSLSKQKETYLIYCLKCTNFIPIFIFHFSKLLMLCLDSDIYFLRIGLYSLYIFIFSFSILT